MIKGLIYDLDDLLVDCHISHIAAFNILLKPYGKKLESISPQIRKTFVGRRVIDICEEIIKALKINVDLQKFYEKRQKIFLNSVKKYAKAMPGMKKSLNLFHKNGYKIALASSGTVEYIDLILDKFKIRHLFDVIISGDCVKIGKPNPEIYLKAAEGLGLNPKECVVLEDAENGIAAAKAAGCKCIAVKCPFTLPQNLKKADLSVGSLARVTLEMVKF